MKRLLAVHLYTPSRIWLTFVLIVMASLACAQSSHAEQPAFVLTSATDHLVIKRVEYLIEPHPLDYIQASDEAYASNWQMLSGKGFNFGDYHAPVWFRFDIVDVTHTNSSWILDVGQQLLDYVDVVLYNHTTGRWSLKKSTGNLSPPGDRLIEHRRFLFPFSLPSGERTAVYLRVESQHALYLTLDVWQSNAFWLHDQKSVLMLGLFFGVLAIMILYNLSLYIFTKDSNYLFYSAYVIAIVLYELAATGIGGLYLWNQSMWIKQNGLQLFASLSFLTGTLFIRQFLSLKQYGGWLLQLNNIFLVVWGVITPLCTFPLFPSVSYAARSAALLSPVAAMVTCIYLWIRGNVQAKYYTIAYAFLDVGTVILMLGYTGVMTRGMITEYSQMVGFVLELVLLSLALADRINRDRAAREEAQQVALNLSQKISKTREEKLMVQEQILDVHRRAKEELERRVLDRTNELERAMKNLELANKELSKLSFTDPLTKVYNRRYFDEILTNEINRASRTAQHLTVIIVDIDHFKQINDLHGHLIGDECLRLVAKTLSQQLGRTSDLIARFGGEEFAMVLPSTPQENAMTVADRARGAVEAIHFIHRGQRIFLRVSLGVAGWIPVRDEKPDQLIQAADKALYLAKSSGRNRAVAANS